VCGVCRAFTRTLERTVVMVPLDDEYRCLECWHSQDAPMPTTWDEQTWQEGYVQGHFEGLEEGHYSGVRAACSDLLYCLHHWGIDLRLGLYGDQSPSQMLHEVARFVEQLCAQTVAPCGGEGSDAACSTSCTGFGACRRSRFVMGGSKSVWSYCNLC
jgi:hypothetical protein